MNKVADNNRNGVVGSKGINIPSIPKNKEIKPSIASKYFKNMFDGCFITLATYDLLSLKPILLCVPSQKGIDNDFPHRQIATLFADAS